MKSWAPVFHFYQPPTQYILTTKEIAHACYLPFLDVFLQNPKARGTFNLSGSLLLQLESLGMKDFFDKINQLIEQGRVDLVMSPMYHPLMPLTPPEVSLRLTRLQQRVLNRFFPKAKIGGFFPPELAVDLPVLQSVTVYSSQCLVDQSSVDASNYFATVRLGEQNLLVSNRMVTEIIRSYNQVLNAANFEQYLLNMTDSHGEKDGLCISVNDAEIFGHHYRERIDFLNEIFKSQIVFKTLSEVGEDSNTFWQIVDRINPSTWQTTGEQLRANNPYSLWLNQNDQLQTKYEQFSDFVFSQLNKFSDPDDESSLGYAWRYYYQGISSCHLYWLSNWPWWHPDLVQAGATNLVKAVRTLEVGKEIKSQAETLYHDLLHDMWQFHWSGKVEERYGEYGKYLEENLKKLPNLN